jgi:type II secretory pathway component GspD/PulD (secretin)
VAFNRSGSSIGRITRLVLVSGLALTLGGAHAAQAEAKPVTPDRDQNEQTPQDQLDEAGQPEKAQPTQPAAPPKPDPKADPANKPAIPVRPGLSPVKEVPQSVLDAKDKKATIPGVTTPRAAVPGQPVKAQPLQPALDANGNPIVATQDAPPPILDGGLSDDAAPAAVVNADDTVTLSAFSEPVQLSALVNLLASTLNINVSIIGDLQGTVAFNAAVPVKKTELLPLIDSLLGQSGWTITQDSRTGWYLVVQESAVPMNFAGQIITTRVFSTPNIRPSSVMQIIQTQLGSGGNAGQPAQGGGKMQAFDDLGIIMVTDSSRKLAMIEEMLNTVLAEFAKAKFVRVELTHLSAPAAKDRVLQLLQQAEQGNPMDPNQAAAAAMRAAQQGQPGMGGGGSTVSKIDNIGERLTIDPAGNALIFRGIPAEGDKLRELLSLIDIPNSLNPRRFFAGANAGQIAQIASAQGLGQVMTIGQGTDVNGAMEQMFQNNGAFQQNNLNRMQNGMGGMGGESAGSMGGPRMLVDQANGNIIYYGTDTQHAQLDKLVTELDIQAERIVIQEYRLKNSKAEDVADVVMGLLNNETPVGDSALLPDGGSGSMNRGGFGSFSERSRSRRSGESGRRNPSNPADPEGVASAPGGGDGLELDGANAFVIADIKNNQLLVKAPANRQGDFAKLIERLDLRRPQVYLEVQIITVTWSDDLRLAFETQLINSNGTGGVLQQNFGLTTAGATITDRRNVATGLAGLTAAIVKTDQLPIVVNALQTKTDTKIISNPALLVDDNEEAELMSVEEQPFTTTQVSSGTPNTTSFGGYESAGTKLLITPTISEDGYLRLSYETELSSFTSATGTNGSPPPKLVNTIKSESITVPSDTTVIVGGLNVDTRRKTRIQVPLLGDIPIIGQLFQDYSRSGRITTLYVFITPRIMREPNFADLRLLTEGPQKRAQSPRDYPKLTPTAIDISDLPEEDHIHPSLRQTSEEVTPSTPDSTPTP